MYLGLVKIQDAKEALGPFSPFLKKMGYQCQCNDKIADPPDRYALNADSLCGSFR